MIAGKNHKKKEKTKKNQFILSTIVVLKECWKNLKDTFKNTKIYGCTRNTTEKLQMLTAKASLFVDQKSPQ